MSSALAEMRRDDPDSATAAEVAWRCVDGSDDAGLLSQWRVQSFCWLALPRDRAIASPWRVATSLADLLDLMSFRRYADIARSDTTRSVLEAAAESDTRCRKAADEALRQSGIQPPDTELLSWAHRCGPSEAAAYVRVADALEMAVQLDDYVPGRARWRQRREDITNRVLATERPDLGDRAPYEGIVAERLLAWTRNSGSPTRERLLGAVEPKLAQAVTTPEPAVADRVLGRVARFLAVVGPAAPLTPSGYLKPAVVARCVDDIGLAGEVHGPSRRESDVTAVRCLREAVQRLGLVRRRAGHLVPTPAGRAAASDVTALWHAVVTRLIPEPALDAPGGAHASLVVWDVLLATLLDHDEAETTDTVETCTTILDESGWRLTGGAPVDTDTVNAMYTDIHRDLRWLGLLTAPDPPTILTPTPGAAHLLLAALRHRLLHSRTLLCTGRPTT